jgi:hypothetical protein
VNGVLNRPERGKSRIRLHLEDKFKLVVEKNHYCRLSL